LKGKYVIVTISILFVSAIAWTRLNSEHNTSFPESLGEMKLTNKVTGQEAIESTRQLHGNSAKVQMKDAAILWYSGSDSDATIWVSRTENNKQASSLLKYMNDAIDPGDGFTYPLIVRIPRAESISVYYVYGYGSDHYYYLNGDSVYWIAISDLPDETRLEFVSEVINRFD
jgi:hypothetical protein